MIRLALVLTLAALPLVPDAALAQRTASSTHRRELVGRQFDARVVRVADGDTLEALIPGEPLPVRLRLEGIDAPELGEPFSDDALKYLRALVGTGPVRVAGRDLDNYGRLVARIVVGAQDASTALVRAGLACHAYARDAALAREESQARAAGSGFWAVNAKKPGCVARTAFSTRQPNAPPRPLARETRALRGNTASRLYHASWCPNYNCRNCTRLFASEAEAKLAGFNPAADCLKK